ncbi:MAG: monovalent cation/H+ antiporter subunit D family protein [Acidobacteriota bacterium]|jgi:multicomponent Na+:H+ antiporter subunit D|nr:monovalent cation/H+ antiporter subunit D family protein [Acidobacteriota bacterium]
MILSNSPALAPLSLLLAAILIPMVAFRKRWLAYPLAMCASAFATIISVVNVVRVLAEGTIHYHFGGWLPPIGIEYVLDPLSAFVSLVINAVSLLVLLHAHRSVAAELPDRSMPYYAVVMLMLTGFNGIVMTGDFFNLYVFLEISSLALYGMIAVGNRKAPVAAFRYLIMGTVGGSFYLLGVGFLYMTTGSLNMADVARIAPTLYHQPALVAALGLMVTGLGIKMAIFPLHGWLPDAYTYAPSASSALIAPVGAKVGAYAIIRVIFYVFGVDFVRNSLPLTEILAWLGAIAIIYGSIMAMAQKEMKRMLAYSSVAQIGYIGLGIGLANAYGIIGAVLHVMNHAVMKACLFLVAGNYRIKLGHSTIPRLDHRVRKRMPWTTAAFAAGALSMVGVPPTVGFFSKWYLALGTIQNHRWLFLAALLVSSLLNAIYFFRILEKVYMKPMQGEVPDDHATAREEAPASMLTPTLILATALVILGLLNAVIVSGIIQAIVPPGM